MIGDTRNFKFRGIAPRAIAQVFSTIAEHPEKEFQVSVSYIEIYNERCGLLWSLLRLLSFASVTRRCVPRWYCSIFDLLAGPSAADAADYQIVEDKTRGTIVRG